MDLINGYSIVEALFEGRRTVVYRATRLADSAPVILKVLNAEYPTLAQIARLRREYRVTRAAEMEGVIRAHGIEKHRSSVALVMEDFGGEALLGAAGEEAMEIRPLLGIAARVAGALGRLHRRRIIHKDVNPSNIVWNPETGVAKLIDFGIATELSREEQAVLSPDVIEGTLAYMSPEQTGRMNRALDYRTDLYSLGVTLYRLLTGRLPFAASDPMELVHCHIAQLPPPVHEVNPAVPATVSRIVERLMAKRAEDRYQSAFALEADLGRCLAELEATGAVSSFTLGLADVPDRFQLPQKLYGREREIAALLEAFDRVAQGGREMMLVAGYSGIGKSALVHEVHRPIVKRRGYFISGKFDQFNRNIPYASLIQAVQGLVRQLLSEPAEQLARWRDRILAAVGPNAQVITEVIPEVALIVGAQPPAPELPPRESQNRFNLTFESFFRVFADESHPLAIFLDDLQWADLPSLKLLEGLMTDAQTRHMFLIGAFRDNEVDAAHPLLSAAESIVKLGGAVQTVTLSPLSLEHCVELLADALRASAAEVAPLGQVCLEKTGGNPFFLNQFLIALHEEGKLVLDEGAGRWRWSVEEISRMGMTDNVVDLMVRKIRQLPEGAQRALQLSACIGSVVDLPSLALVSEARPAEAAAALWPALKDGLLVPLGDSYKFLEDEAAGAELYAGGASAPAGESAAARARYRFLHDRVQQAAYSMIPEAQRGGLHLRVGRQLLAASAAERAGERDERLFAIVNHLNLGSGLIADEAERDQLAALNLAAGSKAKASAAYSAAYQHVKAGLALIGDGGWARRPDLALDLHLLAAEASYLDGKFAEIDTHVAAVLAHTSDVLVQVRIAEIRIQSFNVQNRLNEALRAALDALALLGVTFPERPSWGGATLAGDREIMAALEGRPIAALADLPPMTDPHMAAAMRILAMMIPTSYLADPALFPLIGIRQVALSLAHGNTGASATGYGAHGVIVAGALDRIEDGYQFGKLAIRVLEQFNAKEHEARTRYLFSCFLQHWKEPVRETSRAFKDIYNVSVETGDLDFAGYALATNSSQLALSGLNLAELERTLSVNLQALEQVRHAPCTAYTKALSQLTQNLLGMAPEPWLLIGEAYDERETIPLHRDSNDTYGFASAHVWKTLLSYLFGRYEEALAHADVVRQHVQGLVGHYHVPVFYLYDALTRLACYPTAPEEARAKLLEGADGVLERMRVWAEHAPMNHGHKRWMVEAERCRALGDAATARLHFYRAMALAREHELLNEEALATELFARFLLEQGEQEAAQLFMTKARHLYHLWGAAAKVRDLEQRHPTLLARSPGRSAGAFGFSVVSTTTLEEQAAGDALDLVSVLNASQAISSEVVLPELLRKLMRLVLENAGARRGFLIVEGDSPLFVEADQTGGADRVILHAAPVEQRDDLAQSVVRYVRRTNEVVVLGDAASAGPFQADPYVARREARSILCQPILHKKARAAVLYLENDLVANAFTPDRCKVLELLSAQAAISLENARVYETLERRVQERTQELSEALAHLRQTQRQLVLQEKLASLGMLTSGIAHEIKNPLNFINNFASLSVDLAGELVEEVRGGGIDAERAALLAELAETLQQNAAKISDHGRRVDDIVRGMLEHARSGGGERQEVDLNRLVTEHVNLAYQAFRLQNRELTAQIQLDLDPDVGPIVVGAQEIGRVLQNLVNNACYALLDRQRRAGPSYAPVLRVETRGAGDQVEIRVRDNGCGIAPGIRDQVWNPFFTTKPPGQGTGLGLSLSHDIVVQGHGGTMTFETEENSFTEFQLVLPRRSDGRGRRSALLEVSPLSGPMSAR